MKKLKKSMSKKIDKVSNFCVEKKNVEKVFINIKSLKKLENRKKL